MKEYEYAFEIFQEFKIPRRYRELARIRAFEETILELFSQNRLSGTTHTYIGEEATAVALMQYVTEKDVVFSNHRCHGHYLAYGGAAEKLLAEIMSKESGLCQGRGGSQHIHYKNFYTNGVQGGIVPNALGVAFAKKMNEEEGNTIVFLGDGTLGQGVVYEAMNIAAVQQVPLIFVIEDNQYAMSTRRQDVISGSILKRCQGFDIHALEIESTDVDELSVFFETVFDYINRERKPICAIVHNYRLAAHSKGDDTRPFEEIEEYRKKDPLAVLDGRVDGSVLKRLCEEYKKEFYSIADRLESEPVIKIEKDGCRDVPEAAGSFLHQGNARCVELLQTQFAKEAHENRDIIFLGEDISDPYGGAFKATKGLSTLFRSQVFNMPISEACMVGMGTGMALAGKIPVVEMMFGDFLTLGFDQLLNHAAKYAWIYGNDVKVPLIVRAPMGGKRGYGPTHSQSLEKYLLGIPLLRVLALSPLHDPAAIYHCLFTNITSPTVVIENKKLYAEKIADCSDGSYRMFHVREINHSGYSTMSLTMDEESRPDYCLLTYGGMVQECLKAAEELMLQDEIQVDVAVLSQLSPLPAEDIKECVCSSSTIVFVEEGTRQSGIGAEVLAFCAENKIGDGYIRIAALDLPIPNGILLEKQLIPGKESIISTIKEDYYGK